MGAFFRGLITKTVEFKTLSSTSTSHLATMMKWKTDVHTLQFFIFTYNIFSFEDRISSLEPLCHKKRQDKYILPTHPPKTSDWRFVWQNVLPDKMGLDVAP